jgi:hypothetical protein
MQHISLRIVHDGVDNAEFMIIDVYVLLIISTNTS